MSPSQETRFRGLLGDPVVFDFLEGGRDRDWRPARVESDGIEKRFFASFSFLLRFCLRWKKGRRERFIFFFLEKI